MANRLDVVVCRYKEDLAWVEDLDNNPRIYVYNRGDHLNQSYKNADIIDSENVGANQYVILEHISKRYDQLANMTLFLQGAPYDHCNKAKFSKLINSKGLQYVDSYREDHRIKLRDRLFAYYDKDGHYTEANTDGILKVLRKGKDLKIASFDHLMRLYFVDYRHLFYHRFSPGSQYIVPRSNIHQYPQSFYSSLLYFLRGHALPVEGHLIERCLGYIFENRYSLWVDWEKRFEKHCLSVSGGNS